MSAPAADSTAATAGRDEDRRTGGPDKRDDDASGPVQLLTRWLRVNWAPFVRPTLCWFGAFYVLYAAAHRYLQRAYPHLTPGVSVDLATRVPSTLHALFTTYAAVRTIHFPAPELARDPFHGRDAFASFVQRFSLGYFLADFLALWRHRHAPRVASAGMYAHHLMSIISCVIIHQYNRALYYSLYRFSAEGSTVFLNARAFANALLPDADPRRNHPLLRLNELAFVCSFLLIRLGILPGFYRHIRTHWDGFKRMSVPLQWTFVGGNCVYDALNYVWSYQIVKKLIRMIKPAAVATAVPAVRS